MSKAPNELKLITTQCRTCSYVTAHVGKIEYMAQGIPRCTICEQAVQEAQDLLSSIEDIGGDLGGLL